ncbi:MAG: serine hydrolase domain-containing protein [Armatimonadota bacterium]
MRPVADAWAAPPPESLDSLVESLRAAEQIPALGLAVVRGSSVVGLGVTGHRQAGSTNPVQARDRFHLGSNTKPMTATLLAVLVEQGKIGWTTTIGDVFSSLRDRIHAHYHSVTLSQLLMHQSGLPDDTKPDPVLWPQVCALSGPIVEQRRQLVELVLSRAPAAPPGSRFQYSNAGYTIAGAMAEAVAGLSWEELMAQHVFGPLAMTSAGFGAPGAPGATDQPWGHTSDGCRSIPPGPAADNPLVIGPAGTVHGSLRDWAAFASLHLRGARGEGGLLLRPETFQQLHQPAPENYTAEGRLYAHGWVIAQWARAGGTALAHAGTNTLWYAVIWVAPARDVAFLTATNCGGDAGFRACDAAIGAASQRYL